jgi:hypothetical protein
MDTFSKKILLDTTPFEVHFTMINAPNGIKFFVFACDQGGNTSSFNMERSGNEWRIVNAPKVTELILKSEKRLSEAINQALENSE